MHFGEHRSSRIKLDSTAAFWVDSIQREMTTGTDAYLGFFPEAEMVFGICCPLGTDYRPIIDTLRNYLLQFGYLTNEIKLSDKFNDLLEKLGLQPMSSTLGRRDEMA